MIRGRRATKKICASVLSTYGIDRSKTLPRSMWVLPTSGARSRAAAARAPNPASVHASRRRMSLRSAKRHHRDMTGTRMELHVRVDAVQLTNAIHGQDLFGRTLGQHAALLQQDQPIADRCGEV